MALFSNRILRALPALALLVAMGCVPHSGSAQAPESRMAKSTLQDVLKKNTDFLLSIPGVTGVAIGESEGKPCILVLVAKKDDPAIAKIPSQLEGFPVVVEETGAIHRLGAKAATRPG
jgi:hypothetical protein